MRPEIALLADVATPRCVQLVGVATPCVEIAFQDSLISSSCSPAVALSPCGTLGGCGAEREDLFPYDAGDEGIVYAGYTLYIPG